MNVLIEIQHKLNAPKNLRNTFWKYNYRSAEWILEALKPLLFEYKCIINLCDELVYIWDRYYIKSTATLKDENNKIIDFSIGYAREEENKKWMDWSQITWGSSSYARKYALNWLFAIDDWRDSDATNTHEANTYIGTKDVKKTFWLEKEVSKWWYNDFDLHKDRFIKKIQNKETTGQWIINWLNKAGYKISADTINKILELNLLIKE